MRDQNVFSMSVLNSTPDAFAIIRGGDAYPGIMGAANFYQTKWNVGIMVEVELSGLPNNASDAPRFLAMHIHENGNCEDNFANTGMHYNPTSAVHPYHLGDLPAVLNSNGYAYIVFYDSFLSIHDIMDRSIIIHGKRDDFTSQPSGDAGDKIACGVITKTVTSQE